MTITREAVLAIIAEESRIPLEKLAPEATLIDLDIGSIDIASAVFEIEERFGVTIEPDAISRDFTLGQFVDHVMSLAPG
ncbi:acyl carrier protein [Novosphingobium album (ex Liu et al. 2023)]|uniref:Phosphopantetheine-binding protein n=1 Tax=Novosphingobium album (ex Liu et al. 2023) TaxID=3031130 RepID=A0ABT5WME7_9SPHN|nr:phosphopantetheine-binding protein [Novosphingobium album (ex Liu et al. 2023)]MDE8650457.1 phosphopantetheine-binding protein [Novosphingobium album (ex Liu et al. 2023)]